MIYNSNIRNLQLKIKLANAKIANFEAIFQKTITQ
jgi:hypothetical protein